MFVDRRQTDVEQATAEKTIIMPSQDKVNFEKGTKRGICWNDFEEDDKEVRDHCHFIGKFTG